MEGFYGGQPGSSFVLKAAFKTIAEMQAAFKQGADYTKVWYGEYCLIDTENKNDITNGSIYRRTANYNATNGGAEYIGRIIGPASGTPYFDLGDYAGIKSNVIDAEVDVDSTPVYYYKDSKGNAIRTKPTSVENIYTGKYNTSNALKPGKYINTDGSAAYNDTIDWKWVNVRKNNTNDDSIFYVGFEIPYTVIDLQTTQVTAYDPPAITEIEDKDSDGNVIIHPFYKKWNIDIPKGIKGDSLQNLKVLTGGTDFDADDNRITLYYPSAFGIVEDEESELYGTTSFDNTKYIPIEKIKDLANNKRQILVYVYCVFDKREYAEYNVYLGEYNMVESISLSKNGLITIDYTYDDSVTLPEKIRWIDNINLNTKTYAEAKADSGKMIITYNTLQNDLDSVHESTDFKLSWLTSAKLGNTGTITYSYVGKADTTEAQTITWVTDTSFDKSTGIFKIVYNNSNINLYKDGELQTGTNTLTTVLNLLQSVTLGEDGYFVGTWTNGTDGTYKENFNTAAIEWIKSVTFDPDTGKFNLSTNLKENKINIQLKYPIKVETDTLNRDLIFTFSNGDKTIFQSVLSRITSASISTGYTGDQKVDNGKITFFTNDEEPVSIKLKQLNDKGIVTDTDFSLRSIENITLNTGINEDKHIAITYNNSNVANKLGDSINDIEDVVVSGDSSKTLYVLFSDRSKRYPYYLMDDASKYDDAIAIKQIMEKYPLDENSKTSATVNGAKWKSGIVGTGQSSIYPDSGIGVPVYWRNFGSIKDEAGVLIGGQLTEEEWKADRPDFTTVESYLDFKYSTGREDGKIIIYAPTGSENKEFYAFNYDTNHWFKIGTLSEGVTRDIIFYDEHNNSTTNVLDSTAVPVNSNDDTGGMLAYNGLAFSILARPTLASSDSTNPFSLPSPWKVS